MKLITRPRIRHLALAFIGAGVLAAATAGLASADAAGPTTPVPGTNCTVAQAEDNLAAQNPAIYQKIMQYPDSAQGLADALALSPSDRADHWAEVHPPDADNRQIFLGVHGWSEAERNAAEAAIDQAAETCQA